MNLQSYHQQLWDYHLQLWGELCMSTDRLTPPEIDKPTPSPTTVDDLPSETLHLVCEHIHDDPATLKNLRLVSGKFNKVAITHLFHTILLYQHPGRYVDQESHSAKSMAHQCSSSRHTVLSSLYHQCNACICVWNDLQAMFHRSSLWLASLFHPSSARGQYLLRLINLEVY